MGAAGGERNEVRELRGHEVRARCVEREPDLRRPSEGYRPGAKISKGADSVTRGKNLERGQTQTVDCSREPPPLDPETPDEPSAPPANDTTDEVCPVDVA